MYIYIHLYNYLYRNIFTINTTREALILGGGRGKYMSIYIYNYLYRNIFTINTTKEALILGGGRGNIYLYI